MRTRRQLLMWTLVILVLSLVLFNRLRDTSAIAGHIANEAQLDVMEIDLTSISAGLSLPKSESDLLESRAKSKEKSVVHSQSPETTTETLGYKTE
ncbi:hypothetical protein HYR99_24640 [Candidatus Poribacteria bacterium]|nr:hypothetical protein [Candidatus Poribacteria bacterium]